MPDDSDPVGLRTKLLDQEALVIVAGHDRTIAAAHRFTLNPMKPTADQATKCSTYRRWCRWCVSEHCRINFCFKSMTAPNHQRPIRQSAHHASGQIRVWLAELDNVIAF
nr:hypothetical protein [Thermomonas carbonis]